MKLLLFPFRAVTWLIRAPFRLLAAPFHAAARTKRVGKSLGEVGEWESLPQQANGFVVLSPAPPMRSVRGARGAARLAPRKRISARRRNRHPSSPSVDQSYSYGLFFCESWTTNTDEKI
jgi:hypothetical protein